MSTSRVTPRTIPAIQRERARTMRNASTPAERKLWSRLRASSLMGYKFSRQISVGPYICDFVCRQAKLAIELDGSQHSEEGDRARTDYLKAKGYVVMRFWNQQVLQDVDTVLLTILAEVGTLGSALPPAPPASGRGEE
jgi:very-short-patch-repair endonuclease